MEQIYKTTTQFLFIRKSDNKVLKRYSTGEQSVYFLNKKKGELLAQLLKHHTDLDPSDIKVTEHKGSTTAGDYES